MLHFEYERNIMYIKVLLLSIFTFVFNCEAVSATYKCKDKSNKITYSDVPCVGSEVTKVRIDSGPSEKDYQAAKQRHNKLIEDQAAVAAPTNNEHQNAGQRKFNKAAVNKPSIAIPPGKSCTITGATALCADGTTYQNIGNVTIGSDGTSTQRIGNQYLHSNGTTSTKIGNTVIHSNGQTSTQIGNTTLHSNGKVCNTIGNTVICN